MQTADYSFSNQTEIEIRSGRPEIFHSVWYNSFYLEGRKLFLFLSLLLKILFHFGMPVLEDKPKTILQLWNKLFWLIQTKPDIKNVNTKYCDFWFVFFFFIQMKLFANFDLKCQSFKIEQK